MASGEVVSWFQGRMEWGPRALIPAVAHVDDSGRLQTVDAHTNPR